MWNPFRRRGFFYKSKYWIYTWAALDTMRTAFPPERTIELLGLARDDTLQAIATLFPLWDTSMTADVRAVFDELGRSLASGEDPKALIDRIGPDTLKGRLMRMYVNNLCLHIANECERRGLKIKAGGYQHED